MLRFRVVALSGLLSLVLASYQVSVPTGNGPVFTAFGAQALAAAAKEQKVTAIVALPGVQVETLHPYAHIKY
jgi:hypothetical protein